MQRYNVNEKEISKEGLNLSFPMGAFLYNLQEYINKTLVNYVDIQLENSLELVVENGTYVTFKDEVIYKPICHLLNVEYQEMEANKKFNYYFTSFGNKLTELSLIKTEGDLIVKFPNLYSIYTKRKEQIAAALDIYSKTCRIVPSKEARLSRTKYLIKNKMDEKLYNQLLMEASCFNIAYFVNCVLYDLTILVNNLPGLMNNVLSFFVDVNSLPNIDQDKVASIVSNDVQIKR